MLVAAAACASFAVADGAAAEGRCQKRLIGHGWDLLAVRPADVARNLDACEKLPLDGLSLAVTETLPDGTHVGYGSVMTDPAWDKAWFREEVKTLRLCASRNLTCNFLTVFGSPAKRLAWRDDAAWGRFAHNLGVAAWLAREGHAKGLLFDAEDYRETRQFFRAPDDPPFSETAACARRRGAQIMRSLAAEYPDITLLSFWLLSLNPAYLADEDPRAAAAAAGDLWPAFVNGLLDALPPGARLVDGNEHAYRYEAARNDFYLSAWRMQNRALALVEPENRAKYQTQVLAGFGLYLDMYTNPTNAPWYFGAADGSRLHHLRNNAAQALDAAQEYVWVYGEKMDWIRWAGTPREKNTTWDDALPGFSETLAYLRAPRAWMERIVGRQRQEGTLTNLLQNGDVRSAADDRAAGFRKGAVPVGWWFWQDEKKRPGVFGTDTQNGRGDTCSLCAAGVENGCFGASVRTAPGRRYAVEVDALGSSPRVEIGWKRNGAWDWSIATSSVRLGEAGADGWRNGFGWVLVPAGADELVLMLGVRQGEGERTWFDNARLYEVPVP